MRTNLVRMVRVGVVATALMLDACGGGGGGSDYEITPFWSQTGMVLADFHGDGGCWPLRRAGSIPHRGGPLGAGGG